MQFQISAGVSGAHGRVLSHCPLPHYIPSLENCLSKTRFNQANCPLLSQATSDWPLPAPGDPETRADRSPPGSNSSAGAPPSAQECGRAAAPARGAGEASGRAEAAATGGCPAGELGGLYPRLPGLSSSDRAARSVAAAGCRGPASRGTLSASPCRGWSRRASRCSFRPAPGPEVRRRHGPAASSAGRSRRSGRLVRACSVGSGEWLSVPRGTPGPHPPLLLRGRARGLRGAERRRLGARPCCSCWAVEPWPTPRGPGPVAWMTDTWFGTAAPAAAAAPRAVLPSAARICPSCGKRSPWLHGSCPGKPRTGTRAGG